MSEQTQTRPPRAAQRLAKPTQARPYGDLPDEFLLCLLRRQHLIDPAGERRVYVRLQYNAGFSEDLCEYTGKCARCGTTRVTLRQRYGTPWHHSTKYEWPDGYRAPLHSPWDRAALLAEYDRRHPISSTVELRQA